MNILKSSLLAIAVAAGSIGGAHAAEDTATFQVKIVITESCDIHTTAPTDIDFGTQLRSTGAPVTRTGTITVNCSSGTPYTIGLNGGLHSTGSLTAPAAGERRMASGTGFVPYDLFRNASFSQFWGNTPGVDTQAGTGNANNQSYTVHARVPSTDYAAGTYLDTVTAKIVY